MRQTALSQAKIELLTKFQSLRLSTDIVDIRCVQINDKRLKNMDANLTSCGKLQTAILSISWPWPWPTWSLTWLTWSLTWPNLALAYLVSNLTKPSQDFSKLETWNSYSLTAENFKESFVKWHHQVHLSLTLKQAILLQATIDKFITFQSLRLLIDIVHMRCVKLSLDIFKICL